MTPTPEDPILKMYLVPRVFNGPHSRDTHCKGPGGHTRRREIPHVRDFVFSEPEMDASHPFETPISGSGSLSTAAPQGGAYPRNDTTLVALKDRHARETHAPHFARGPSL